ncbi:MAG: hypothetical protein DMD89_31790 [Candidatus Rokuibacteriota bacterium]|nr:MAG: hypothetical protein DMD89_31790 [Candidatus Rokubacteria bacterium]
MPSSSPLRRERTLGAVLLPLTRRPRCSLGTTAHRALRLVGLLMLPLVLVTPMPAAAQSVLWSTYFLSGTRAFEDGRFDQAERLYQSALKEAETFAPNGRPMVMSLLSFARLYAVRGKWGPGEELVRRALPLIETAWKPTDVDAARALSMAASFYLVQRTYPPASSLIRAALAIVENALGAAHADLLSYLSQLGEITRLQAEYPESEAAFRRVLMIREREWGPNHPGVSSTLIDVALLQQIRGDRAEAAGPRARALAILSRTSLEAERQYRRTLAVMENVMGRAHPSVARALYDLAALEESAEHYTEAEPLAARALEILQEALGSDHLYLAAGRNNPRLCNRSGRSFHIV